MTRTICQKIIDLETLIQSYELHALDTQEKIDRLKKRLKEEVDRLKKKLKFLSRGKREMTIQEESTTSMESLDRLEYQLKWLEQELMNKKECKKSKPNDNKLSTEIADYEQIIKQLKSFILIGRKIESWPVSEPWKEKK